MDVQRLLRTASLSQKAREQSWMGGDVVGSLLVQSRVGGYPPRSTSTCEPFSKVGQPKDATSQSPKFYDNNPGLRLACTGRAMVSP